MNFQDILRIASGLHNSNNNNTSSSSAVATHENEVDNDNSNNNNNSNSSSNSNINDSSSLLPQSQLLSLQQLVPVHQSLLETVSVVSASSSPTTTDAVTNSALDQESWSSKLGWFGALLMPDISDSINDDDESLLRCQTIIFSRDRPRETGTNNDVAVVASDDRTKLFAWQYLLQRAQTQAQAQAQKNEKNRNTSMALDWFTKFLFHYLFSDQNSEQISDALRDVVVELSLDWVWKEEGTTSTRMMVENDREWSDIRRDFVSITTTPTDQTCFTATAKSKAITKVIVMNMVLFYLRKQQQQWQQQHTTTPLLHPRVPFFLSMYYEQVWYHLESVITLAINNKTRQDSSDDKKSDSSQSVTLLLSEISKRMILPMLQQEFENCESTEGERKDGTNDHSRMVTERCCSHIHAREMSRLFTRLFLLLTMKGVLLSSSTSTSTSEDEEEGSRKKENHPKQTEDLLLIATTVLCPFLPWYWKHQQQQQQQQQPQKSNQIIEEEERQNPDITKPLWTLIYVCLQQGRRSVVQGGSGGGGGGGRGNSNSGDTQSYYSSTTSFGIASLLRRRALYLLDVVTTTPTTITTTTNTQNNNMNNNIWKDYILCAETFEMECERHIVDQLWSVVVTLIRHCEAAAKYSALANDSESDDSDDDDDDDDNSSNRRKTMILPPMTSKWMELLLGRIVSSEQLAVRKLGVFRLLQVLGRPLVPVGSNNDDDERKTTTISTPPPPTSNTIVTAATIDIEGLSKTKKKRAKRQHNQQQQHQKKNKKKSGGTVTLEGLSTELLLTSLSPDTFLWDILVPAWDSLGGSSVGYTMHLENTGGTGRDSKSSNGTQSGIPIEKFTRIDMIPLFSQMIQNYTILASASTTTAGSLSSSSISFADSSHYWKGLWDYDRVLCHLSAKTLLLIYRAVTDLLVPVVATTTEQEKVEKVGKETEEVPVSAAPIIDMIPMDDTDLMSIRYTVTKLFCTGLLVLSHRKQFLQMLSVMFSQASRLVILVLPESASDVAAVANNNATRNKNKNWSPMNVLSILGLFASTYFPSLDSDPEWMIENETTLMNLGTFLCQWEDQHQQNQKSSTSSSSSYTVTVGATLASAFVTGQVALPSSSSSSSSSVDSSSSHCWNPVAGSSTSEQELGWAVALFCTLAVSSSSSNNNNNHSTKNTGELLWPAIHKGMSQSSSVTFVPFTNAVAGHLVPNKGAEKVSRALLLLENGCRLRQISGLGNGDLVVNPKTQQWMPPPPNIEVLLQQGIDFIQWQIHALLATTTHVAAAKEEEKTRTSSKRFTGTYASLISQLKVLHQSYPSSNTVSNVMNELLKTSVEELSQLMDSIDTATAAADAAAADASSRSSDEGDVKKLLLLGLIYGACSCGALPEKKGSYVSLCRLLMRTSLTTAGEGQPPVWVKSSRSIIQYSRWAAISCLLPPILEATSEGTIPQSDLDVLIEDLLQEGIHASSITPSDAIKPLFDCLILSSRRWIGASSKYETDQKVETLYLETLTNIIQVLLSLIQQSTRSRESAYMLNDFCALIFQEKLLREEYHRIQQQQDSTSAAAVGSCSSTPIRDGFRQLIKMAGRHRPHVTRAVLCRITVAWLGDGDGNGDGDDNDNDNDNDNGNVDNMKGISAIPYRDDIVQLLLHKEIKKDEGASNQNEEVVPTSGVTEIPTNTNHLSITRAFLLVFFTQLPDPDDGLNTTVKTELTDFVIQALLTQATPGTGTHPKLVMKGTPTYCLKIRAWQGLCILSRFVTRDIAPHVCTAVFHGMHELLHNQIRYFLENFTIKCATQHPDIFGTAFLKDIARTDLSLQHIASLMVMGGNFIMGRYHLDYFTNDQHRLKQVLAGVIPWLSSTQGFSRAIAQLMVYQLIPRVVDVNSDSSSSSSSSSSSPTTSNSITVNIEDSDWFLKSTYNFLDTNREMKRLRSKQTKFFDRYDCEKMCTPEGVFSIPVDESEEANPLHVIDAMKESLRCTYDEAHAGDAPAWKQVEELMTADNTTDDDGDDDDGDDSTSNHVASSSTSTVQRKIIPLDSLNLALEDLREQRLTNATGAHKQQLIVCASLVDKIPNLAGLARTSEIFAAQSLVIPDLSVAKMDNFQAISVGAADWIEMKEVKEEALLSWLLQKKTEGYWIVGLEQTSSSAPLHEIDIPVSVVKQENKTVLLLGKEKEGIPIQFLQAVDTCIEIPQFGMIRSLNVHVSGALAIWELTRRTRLATATTTTRTASATASAVSE